MLIVGIHITPGFVCLFLCLFGRVFLSCPFRTSLEAPETVKSRSSISPTSSRAHSEADPVVLTLNICFQTFSALDFELLVDTDRSWVYILPLYFVEGIINSRSGRW